MTFGQLLLVLGLGVVVALLIFGSDIVRAWENRPGGAYTKEQRAEFAERANAWREEFEARNPDGPPISEEEHADFDAWLKEQVRPALRLTPQPGSTAQADGVRLGGPVALAEGQAWPVSKGGAPMEFLAQLDFAEMPPLDGFPSDGVLQFFIPQDDDLWGADFDNAEQSDVAVLYRPNGAGAALVKTPLVPAEESVSPFWNKAAQEDGIALTAEPFADPVGTENWEVNARLEGNMRRPGFDRWERLLEAQATSTTLNHHTGGYPVFVQWDFRKPGELDDYDTVLLRLTSDDYVQWGDVGEANFLIRSEDLEARDFTKVIFWWDAH